jgi:ethanolamine utilization protein EutQ
MKKYFIQKLPFVVPTTDGKLIEEHHGKASDKQFEISIAHMIAPPHWSEPFQTPEFDEYTYIIKGKKQFIIEDEVIVLEAGQSIKIDKNTRVQYSNPFDEPCEYIAICTPAFDFGSCKSRRLKGNCLFFILITLKSYFQLRSTIPIFLNIIHFQNFLHNFILKIANGHCF